MKPVAIILFDCKMEEKLLQFPAVRLSEVMK
jgi:hypothetical protein